MAQGQVDAMLAQIGAANAEGFAKARVTREITQPLGIAAAEMSGEIGRYETLGKLSAALRGAMSTVCRAQNENSQRGLA